MGRDSRRWEGVVQGHRERKEAREKKERISFYNSALDILFFQLAIYRGFFFLFFLSRIYQFVSHDE